METKFSDFFESENEKDFEKEFNNDENVDEEININHILGLIKEKNEDFFKKISNEETHIGKKINNSVYPLLRWVSCVGINKIDWDEAKRLGRKKGDKKGPWPSKIFDSDSTILNLVNSNEINLYFWELMKKNNLGKNHVFLIYLMIIKFCSSLKNNEDFVWISKPKSKKIKEKIDELILKIFPEANEMEIKILRKKYKNKEGIQRLIEYLGLNNKDVNDYLD